MKEDICTECNIEYCIYKNFTVIQEEPIPEYCPNKLKLMDNSEFDYGHNIK